MHVYLDLVKPVTLLSIKQICDGNSTLKSLRSQNTGTILWWYDMQIIIWKCENSVFLNAFTLYSCKIDEQLYLQCAMAKEILH
jgi:hypothetical protein